MDSRKTVGQNAAVEERPQFPFYESRHRALAITLPRKVGFKMTVDKAAKGIVFRIPGAAYALLFIIPKIFLSLTRQNRALLFKAGL